MNDRFLAQLQFLLEADKLKEVQRRSYLLSGNRLENSAEHSWHLALMAMVLSEYSNTGIDACKVIQMVILHDLVEIEAGDVFLYDSQGISAKTAKEMLAADHIFGLLPPDQCVGLRGLWEEFEKGETAEAKFALALDRIMPMLHNLRTGGRAWREHGVSADQVCHRNAKIADGSKALWSWMKAQLDEAVQRGILSAPDRVREMQDYYRKRAPIYDHSMSYHQEETLSRQRPVIDFFQEKFAGQTVLEVACGPCFWTQFIAETAKHVTAMDYNEETLAEARKKPLDPARVSLRIGDAYRLPVFPEPFDCGFAVDWFSHVPIGRRKAFLTGFHRCIRPGGFVILCDQLPKPEAPIAGSERQRHLEPMLDYEGNRLQERFLPDGSRFTVIKNHPTEQELRALLATSAVEVEYRTFAEARRWVVIYRLP